jgi:hypothetical protein
MRFSADQLLVLRHQIHAFEFIQKGLPLVNEVLLRIKPVSVASNHAGDVSQSLEEELKVNEKLIRYIPSLFSVLSIILTSQ